ncbi:hypothetical protein DL768_008911 [Monosporascus sp. mg162]|nr:hypothetical protein DL768_008911 [Monosporascus sp. mg162]
MSRQSAESSEPIAIVGTACRFPGEASSPSKLWDLLRQPRDVLSEIPSTRFNKDRFFHPDPLHHGTSNVRHSYLLSEDHRVFDAQFFGIKPVEATSIDPQQRMLLEVAYEALESAGIPLDRIQGSRTGVFVGIMTNDYSDLLGRDIDNFPTYFASGTARSIVSNRLSYFFDLHGPSMTVDTACSSSLVALHQAVQSLRQGESSSAIVAGSNLLLGPEQYVAESKLRMLSPSSRSRMWDKKADGYARGDGVAVLVMKTLSQALTDQDSIECIIRETGINQDGRTRGITMPNSTAQAELIRDTYVKAGLDLARPSDRPQFFEAHGTGTPAGDPIEAEAIANAFFGPEAGFSRTVSDPPLFVGSIKTVIGHTEGTAGIAESFTPMAHLLGSTDNELDEHIAPVTPFIFSAASEKSLLGVLAAYASYLRETPTISLRDLSWTLNTRRSTLPARVAFSALDVPSLGAKLDEVSTTASGVTTVSVAGSASDTTRRRILGVFTGQGAQWAAMGTHLLRLSPAVQDCMATLQRSLDTLPAHHAPKWSLKEELIKGVGESRIGQAEFSQPLCTAVQIAIVNLLKAAQVDFSAVVGHSSGEIAAAYAAGYISAEDAIRIAYYRGYFLQNSNQEDSILGAMLAVGITLEDAQELCELPSFEGRICIAACNSPESITLSGDTDAIEEVQVVMMDEKRFSKPLKVDKAYHSHHMLPYATPYTQALKHCGVQVRAGTRDGGHPVWISSVVGEDIASINLESLAHSYWGENMVKTVLFSEAVEYAIGAEGPFDLIVEVGPHPALKKPVTQTIEAISRQTVPYISTICRGKNDIEALADTLGSIWQSVGQGVVDFAAYDRAVYGHDVRPPKLLNGLPSYSWDHERVYWHESRYSRAFRTSSDIPHPLLGTKQPDGIENEIRFKNYLVSREVPWLAHHQVQGRIVFPAAGYISAIVEFVACVVDIESAQLVEVRDFSIGQALILQEDGGVETLLSIKVTERCQDYTDAVFVFYSDGDGALVRWDEDSSTVDYKLSFVLERVAYFFMRQLDAVFPPDRRNDLAWHHRRFHDYADYCLDRVANGTQPYANKEWIKDTEKDIQHLIEKYPSSIDLKLMKAVGEGIQSAMTGQTNILESMMHENMLGDFYAHALGMERYLADMARMIREFSHRFPRMKILEIGAGTGGATDLILRELDNAFGSYTYTDISSGFFGEAVEKFSTYQSLMTFRTLDIEKSPIDQGYSEGSYDLVVASLVLHATRNLERTLANVRKLLRPGGYLVILELTDNDPMRFGFIFGGLPGWWLGYDDGRNLSPCVSADKWDVLTRKSGFSGIDAITPHNRTFPLPLSTMYCQAVDEKIDFLREPLASDAKPLALGSLTVIGGNLQSKHQMLKEIHGSLGKHYDNISYIKSIADVALTELPYLGSVISLVDFDEPLSVFQEITALTLEALQRIFKESRTILWVTSGARSRFPHKNMFVGFHRTIALEMTHFRSQFLDFETPEDFDVNLLAKRLLQLEAYRVWEESSQTKDILWYCEPEVLVQGGKIHLPRFRLSDTRNQRYNSVRRHLTQEISIDTTIVSIRAHESQLRVEEKSREVNHVPGIRLRQSLLKAVLISDRSVAYLSEGVATNGQQVIVLSKSLDSYVYTPDSWTITIPGSREQALQALIGFRNPKVDDVWRQEMASQGCIVKIFANDVTDRHSLRLLHRNITESMPPIAGVAQGAMVLHDTLFPDLDLERLEKVIQPKVDGSTYLDEIFQEDTLDFFVFLSSMAYVTGNAGQSAYTAANAFMASLASQRRNRGLAGSIINIGAIIGNGYVSRELTLEQQSSLQRAGHSWMSEQDFHEIFAEGVLASRLEIDDSYEIATGLRLEEDGEMSWVSNPMFQHLVVSSENLVEANSTKRKPGVAMKPQILEATSDGQVFEILKDGFVTKLQAALRTDPERQILSLSPDELGVDSLVAVDIQSWLRKELSIEMPILEILDAPSVQDLIYIAKDLLASELVPKVNGDMAATHPQFDIINATQDHPVDDPSETINSMVDIAKDIPEGIITTTSSQTTDLPSDRISTPASDIGTQDSETAHIINSGVTTAPTGLEPPDRFRTLDALERKAPMSFAQSRFWFLSLLEEDKTIFNITSTVHLNGRIDADRLQVALTTVGWRHQALRTIFYTDSTTNQHMQGVLPAPVLRLEHEIVRGNEEVKNAIEEMRNHVFDLSKGECLRMKLLSFSDDHHCIILAYHHIFLDGLGFSILFSDLEKAYDGVLDISAAGVLQYPDFTIKQRREYEQGLWSKQIDYWLDTKTTSDDAFANSHVPFDVLLNELGVPRSPSYSPLFQVFLNYRPNIQERRAFCGCDSEGELITPGENAYDISVDIADISHGEDLVVFSVNKDIYTAQDAEVLARSYFILLESFTRNPATRIIWPALHAEKDVEAAISLGQGAQIIDLSDLPPCSEITLHSQAKPSDTAVIAFTSGSTGVPKGIALKHLSYRNFLEFAPPRWHVEEGKEVVLHQSSYAFDFSMLQVMVGLTYGGTIVIPSDADRRDPAAICDLIVSTDVTLTVATPTEYFSWIQYGGPSLLSNSQWRRAICGGEHMTKSLIREFRSLKKPGLCLVNLYGPAESTIGCADCLIPNTDEDSLNSGFTLSPLPNYAIYIVDANMNPVPLGIPGQIMIGGAGHGWTNTYLSGDRGRLDAMGGLTLHGRVEGSTQIKMGGVRIDLEDIENTMVEALSPHVIQVVVSPRRSSGSEVDYLVAFLVLSITKPPSNPDLFMSELSDRLPLPQYMRPSIVVPLTHIPKTSSNKIDRLAIDAIPLPNATSSREIRSNDDLDEMEESLFQLWEEVLPQEVALHHRIDANTDFFHVGGSSIALIKLQKRLKQRMGIQVSLYQLFESITLGQMAKAIQGQSTEVRPLSIDWEHEVEIQSDFASVTKSVHAPNPRRVPRVVVLTGATGFLGKEVLQNLVDDNIVEKIYCIAVRKPQEQLPKLFQHHKVIICYGDLGAKRLRLSEEAASSIFDEADVVIHMGADVSFMKTYQTLKLINALSTRELVRLSLPRLIPFHFVSSATVARLAGKAAFGPVSVEPYQPISNVTDGYTAAKWVNEVYLERINDKFGLPVVIHRPSSITGTDAPESDLMSNLMKYAQQTKAIPDSSSWKGYFDFISVQTVATTMMDAIMGGSQQESPSVRYVYETGETVIAINDIRSVLETGIGESFKVLPLVEWLDVVEQAGMNPLLVAYLRRAASGEVLFPQLIGEGVV